MALGLIVEPSEWQRPSALFRILRIHCLRVLSSLLPALSPFFLPLSPSFPPLTSTLLCDKPRSERVCVVQEETATPDGSRYSWG